MSHGYGSDTGWLFQEIAINYATWGYAVYCADLLGHGRSDGLRCYLGDMEKVAAASSPSSCPCAPTRPTRPSRPSSSASPWAGPRRCSCRHVPPLPARRLDGPHPLRAAARHARGDAALAPAPLPLRPPLRPRRHLAGHARQEDGQLPQVTAPFLALHGTEDGVTAPEGSTMLYDRAASADKTLIVYDGFYHSLVQGESPDNSRRVLADMRAWIDDRVARYAHRANATS
uniref:Serine aminopeptidase S33 domain-containing protein n=1 Tax=Ananas comosus var. bracteatus TaxID=296719 RepID=A0A6V7QQ02_ANACO